MKEYYLLKLEARGVNHPLFTPVRSHGLILSSYNATTHCRTSVWGRQSKLIPCINCTSGFPFHSLKCFSQRKVLILINPSIFFSHELYFRCFISKLIPNSKVTQIFDCAFSQKFCSFAFSFRYFYLPLFVCVCVCVCVKVVNSLIRFICYCSKYIFFFF